MLIAFSPDHDDHHGGAAWRIAFGFGHRHGIGAAASARHHHRGRPHCEPDADAVHHSGGLYLHRSPATVAGKPSHPSSRPGSTAGRILIMIMWWPAKTGQSPVTTTRVRRRARKQ